MQKTSDKNSKKHLGWVKKLEICFKLEKENGPEGGGIINRGWAMVIQKAQEAREPGPKEQALY